MKVACLSIREVAAFKTKSLRLNNLWNNFDIVCSMGEIYVVVVESY